MIVGDYAFSDEMPDEDKGEQEYANLTGLSGISDYQIYPHAMGVRFHGGQQYSYPINDTMVKLAKQGWGLNRYLNKNRGKW